MTPPATARAPAAAPGVALPRKRPTRARPAAPARRRATGPGGARAQQTGGLVLGVLGLVTRVSEHRLFDRLVRGRAWIGIVAFALIGIVSMQLVLLKLNGGIGRALQHEALLQRENAALSVADSAASAGDLVESQAAQQLGMIITPSGGVRFLSRRHGDATHAAENLNKLVTPGASAVTPASSGSPAASTTSTAGTTSTSTATGQSATGTATGQSGTGAATGQSGTGAASSGTTATTAPTAAAPSTTGGAQQGTASTPVTGAGTPAGGVQAAGPRE
ncbi:MAG TPA: hypothetical protein VLJ42_12700 [Solirubrobacteraceae bacterium]|nr:hypothetical protein [Solirubrobacteraceae bacterium]